MTRDDIIRLALEHFGAILKPSDLEVQLAALVAAAEREACARLCEKLPETFKIAADEFGYKAEAPTAENYAAAIRTRSDT